MSPDTGQPEGKREAEQDADDLLLAAPHGPDRVRHLQIKQLWIQDEVQAPGLILQHLPGSTNHRAGLRTFGMNAEEVITFVLQTDLEQAEAMVQQLR